MTGSCQCTAFRQQLEVHHIRLQSALAAWRFWGADGIVVGCELCANHVTHYANGRMQKARIYEKVSMERSFIWADMVPKFKSATIIHLYPVYSIQTSCTFSNTTHCANGRTVGSEVRKLECKSSAGESFSLRKVPMALPRGYTTKNDDFVCRRPAKVS